MSESLLVVGSGGREHALGWRLGESVEGNVLFAPGNAGTAGIGWNLNAQVTDFAELVRIAEEKDAFTVVGPDLPLSKGIVNYFHDQNLPIFGPTKEAAQLEWDNSWAYDFMNRHGIPCPETYYETNQMTHANGFIRNNEVSEYIIRAKGLADGKGVEVPEDQDKAYKFIREVMLEKRFGEAGEFVMFQERLEGEELSLFVMCDGENGIWLPHCRDHKRLEDGDEGPNTGGMGAYTPVEISDTLTKQIQEQIVDPTIKGMAEEGRPYRGMLYIGLMLTKDGPKVIEYNARFGDPECQAQMLLAGDDLYPAMQEAATGSFGRDNLSWRPGHVVTVALAASGYPNEPRIDDQIFGLNLELPPETVVFHAATKRKGDKIFTNGGRVLHIASYGETVAIARERVYQAIGDRAIHFAGYQYRRDIALAA